MFFQNKFRMIGLTLIGSKSKRRNEAGFKDSRIQGFKGSSVRFLKIP
jgi:hypothetical protein